MLSDRLAENLTQIAGQLLGRSREGGVSWQTVGGQPSNYYVHFGDATSFIVCFQPSEDDLATAAISLKVGSAIAVRISAREGEEDFPRYKEIFDEAHRSATGWDKAIERIKRQIASGEFLGDPAGDIPV